MGQARGKELEIPPLVRSKLRRRSISESLIEETLTTPDQIVEGHGARLVAQKRMRMHEKEGLLRVVYEELPSIVAISTVYFTTDIPRYWRDPS
jgi:hypothetical protein